MQWNCRLLKGILSSIEVENIVRIFLFISRSAIREFEALMPTPEYNEEDQAILRAIHLRSIMTELAWNGGRWDGDQAVPGTSPQQWMAEVYQHVRMIWTREVIRRWFRKHIEVRILGFARITF